MTDEYPLDESYYGLFNFPLNDSDEEDVDSKDNDGIKFVKFVIKYSSLFVVMGVFGAITVYLNTIIKDSNSIFLNIGIISSLTIFVILGLSILIEYLNFGDHESELRLSLILDFLFVFSFIMLISIVFLYIVSNQINSVYTLVAGSFFILVSLIIILFYVKHKTRYGLYHSFVMYSLGNSLIVDLVLVGLLLFTDIKQYIWLIEPALYAIGIVIILAIIAILASLISGLKKSLENNRNLWKLIDEQLIMPSYKTTNELSARFSNVSIIEKKMYLILLPATVSAIIFEAICIWIIFSGVIKDFLLLILLVLITPILVLLGLFVVMIIVIILYVINDAQYLTKL
jgi:hypothetical protein